MGNLGSQQVRSFVAFGRLAVGNLLVSRDVASRSITPVVAGLHSTPKGTLYSKKYPAQVANSNLGTCLYQARLLRTTISIVEVAYSLPAIKMLIKLYAACT